MTSMFMRVNLKCAHHVRPPPRRDREALAVAKPLATCLVLYRAGSPPHGLLGNNPKLSLWHFVRRAQRQATFGDAP